MWKTENRALQCLQGTIGISCSRNNKQRRTEENFPERKSNLNTQTTRAPSLPGDDNGRYIMPLPYAALQENKTKQITAPTTTSDKNGCCQGAKILLTFDFFSATLSGESNRETYIWISCVANVADSRIIYPGLL